MLCGVTIVPVCAQTPNECRNLQHHGKLTEARGCFTKLVSASDVYLRAEGLWGLEQYKDANEAFRAALKQKPESVDIRVRWGEFFLDRFNKEEADGLFKEALERKKNDAGALLGLARVASEGFTTQAVEFAEKAA